MRHQCSARSILLAATCGAACDGWALPPIRVSCQIQRERRRVVLDQLRTVDVERLGGRLGRVSADRFDYVLALCQEIVRAIRRGLRRGQARVPGARAGQAPGWDAAGAGENGSILARTAHGGPSEHAVTARLFEGRPVLTARASQRSAAVLPGRSGTGRGADSFCFRIYALTPRPRAQARSVPAAC